MAHFRSLRPTGRIPPHERHVSAGEPLRIEGCEKLIWRTPLAPKTAPRTISLGENQRAVLVLAYRACNRRLQLESRESLVLGASISRDGRGLPSKRSPVRASPLLRYRSTLSSRCGLCRTLGIRDRGAAP